MTVRHVFGVVVLAGLLSHTAFGQATGDTKATYQPSVGQEGKDVIWVPTPQALVDRMLDMVELSPRDTLVDLGSGDGRTVITAAKRGTRARGIEFNPDMVALAKRAAQQAGVGARATFIQGDIFQVDFSDATVVSLFLLPELNVRLRPTLLAMKPGTRIVSNSFDMGDWQADENQRVEQDCETYCTAYLWIVPAAAQGTWKLRDKTLTLKQSYQMLEGSLSDNSGAVALQDARMHGTRIVFTVGNDTYDGQIKGATISGTINGGSAWRASRVR